MALQARGAALGRGPIMILFLLVIKTKPSGRTEFLGAFLVVRVNDFHARTIRLSMYFVGSRKGEGDRDCDLMIIELIKSLVNGRSRQIRTVRKSSQNH